MALLILVTTRSLLASLLGIHQLLPLLNLIVLVDILVSKAVLGDIKNVRFSARIAAQ